MLFITMTFFSCNVLNTNALKCLSIINQENREIINVNSNEPSFYPYNIKVNKCTGSCNDINDPYAKLCVPNVVKNINVKVINCCQELIKKGIEWHETCKCKCRVDASVCKNKCRCECKELLDKGRRDKDLFGIIVNLNVTCDRMMLKNI